MSFLPMQWMGTLREHYVILFSAAGTIGLMAGFIGSWIGGWIGARRAVRSAQLTAPMMGDGSRRELAQLAQMVEAIAIEVERVSEGQRFTTRLLADRLAIPAPGELRSRGADHVTPH
jgi:hypothetical protein